MEAALAETPTNLAVVGTTCSAPVAVQAETTQEEASAAAPAVDLVQMIPWAALAVLLVVKTQA